MIEGIAVHALKWGSFDSDSNNVLWLFIQYLVELGRNQFSIQKNCQHVRNPEQPISFGEGRTHVITLPTPQIFPLSLSALQFCLFINWLVFLFTCVLFSSQLLRSIVTGLKLRLNISSSFWNTREWVIGFQSFPGCQGQ